MEVGGDKENEVLSLDEHPERGKHSSQTSELVSDSQQTSPDGGKQHLDMEETQNDKREASDAAVEEQMASPTHPVHLFEEEHNLDSDPSSPSTLSSKPRALSAAAYANFVHRDASEPEESVNPSPVEILLLSPPGNHNKLSLDLCSSHAHADVGPLLRRELDLKRMKTSELLLAIKSSVQEAVRARSPKTDLERRSSVMSTPLPTRSEDEEEEAPERGRGRGNKSLDQLRLDITGHPLYPETVLTHIEILKIGAPRELFIKLDGAFKTFQRVYKGGRRTSKLGQDPELDYFMKSYLAMLTSFRVHLEEPFNSFMQFMDKTTKELEDLCGHYIETKPEEVDNYGFDISPRQRARDDDNDEFSEKNAVPEEDQTLNFGGACALDIDESIVVDPDAPDEELRKVLRKKFGRHLGSLKPEFNRVRKKGKLPEAARRILKEWFNLHSHWPYPSEMEKAYLQQLCELSQKQINNWFINERKRHWNSEERSMYPNPKSTDDDVAGEGSGHLESW